MSATVKINTSDVPWIERRGHDPVPHGTDITGAMYYQVQIVVDDIEVTTFAGARVARFDIGPDAPRDHNRYAMYPISCVVAGGEQGLIPGEMCYCGGKIRGDVCRDCGAIYPGARVWKNIQGGDAIFAHRVATFDGDWYTLACSDEGEGWDREHLLTEHPGIESDDCPVCYPEEGASDAQ